MHAPFSIHTETYLNLFDAFVTHFYKQLFYFYEYFYADIVLQNSM